MSLTSRVDSLDSKLTVRCNELEKAVTTQDQQLSDFFSQAARMEDDLKLLKNDAKDAHKQASYLAAVQIQARWGCCAYCETLFTFGSASCTEPFRSWKPNVPRMHTLMSA